MTNTKYILQKTAGVVLVGVVLLLISGCGGAIKSGSPNASEGSGTGGEEFTPKETTKSEVKTGLR